MCLVRVLSSLQAWDSSQRVGFPEGLLCPFEFIIKFWVFSVERSEAPEGPQAPPDYSIVSKPHSGQFSFSNPKLRGIVRSTKGDSLTLCTYQVYAVLNGTELCDSKLF